MNIYFSGIGGVGLGPLAEMALDAGYTVAGSDTTASLTTRELEARGIAVFIGDQDGRNLRTLHARTPIDRLVYTAALPDDHPELIAARELGIPISKRDELIKILIASSHQQLIAIAGTHGKTTTTGMMVWACQQLNIPVSYSVGSQLGFGPSGVFDPQARYFIYECDEFDRNFLQFHPDFSIITSIDYDHPDTYPTEADYQAAFRQFIHQSHTTTLWENDADYIDQAPHQTIQCLPVNEVPPLQISGEHNRRNGTLVLKVLEQLGVGDEATRRRALETFPGTIRRFERLGEHLYSDYGHHPAEITATLQMAHELSDHVVLVYQPHQNVRQHEVRRQYVDGVFQDAEAIYWLPTYLTRENPELEILTPAQLTASLTPTKLHLTELDNTLWSIIQDHRNAGHLVLCMGAGSIDEWIRQHVAGQPS